MNRKANKNLTPSPSPFKVQPYEIAGLVSQEEIEAYREQCGYDRLGQTHARADDVKRVVLAKLMHRSPTCGMSIADSVSELIEMWLTLWFLKNPNITQEVELPPNVHNVDNYYRSNVGAWARDALYDLLDDAARTAEGFVRYRVYSFGVDPQDNLERVQHAQRSLATHNVDNLSLLDFDLAYNEHKILLYKKANDMRRQKKIDPKEYFQPSEEYGDMVEEALLESELHLEAADKADPGSHQYKAELYQAASMLRRAIAICDVARHYYDGLRAEDAQQKRNFQAYVIEFEQRIKKLQEELITIKDFAVMYDEIPNNTQVASSKNWYRLAQNNI